MNTRASRLAAMSLLPGLVMLLTACATNTTVTVADSKYKPADPVCNVRFFNRDKPGSDFVTIAKIESHIQKNIFFGKTAKLDGDAYPELRDKACAAGGNGVVIDDYVESRALEFSHVHVWATVIRIN